MDRERSALLDGIINKIIDLTAADRNIALLHLFNLRTAAVEDLSELSNQNSYWETALHASSQPEHIMTLVRDLLALTVEELAFVGTKVSARQQAIPEQILQAAEEEEETQELYTGLAASSQQ